MLEQLLTVAETDRNDKGDDGLTRPEWLTITQAANVFGVAPKTLKQLVLTMRVGSLGVPSEVIDLTPAGKKRTYRFHKSIFFPSAHKDIETNPSALAKKPALRINRSRRGQSLKGDESFLSYFARRISSDEKSKTAN